MQFRKFGFFALVAVALVGCGTAAGASTAGPTPTSTSSGTPVPSSSPAPVCPTPGPNVSNSAYCETPAEVAAGQVLVHSPTISDQNLIDQGVTLTVAPSDSSTISQQDAESVAGANNSFNKNPTSAVFGELHNQFGLPTEGTLVWVVDVTPSTPTLMANGTEDIAVADVFVNATTGAFMYLDITGPPGDTGVAP